MDLIDDANDELAHLKRHHLQLASQRLGLKLLISDLVLDHDSAIKQQIV
jgi:hypothetical protein